MLLGQFHVEKQSLADVLLESLGILCAVVEFGIFGVSARCTLAYCIKAGVFPDNTGEVFQIAVKIFRFLVQQVRCRSISADMSSDPEKIHLRVTAAPKQLTTVRNELLRKYRRGRIRQELTPLPNGSFHKLGFCFGVLVIRALLFGVHVTRGP